MSDVDKETEFLKLCSKQTQWDEADIRRFNELVRDASVDVQCVDAVDRTPLLLLCEFHQGESLCECVSVLLQLRKADVNVNQQDKWGNNALIYLCAKCKGEWILKLVQRLLDHGAVINQKNKYGYDALMCLFSKNTSDKLIDVAQLLISNGMKVDSINSLSHNAMYYLNQRNDLPNKQQLIQLLSKVKIFYNICTFYSFI